MSKRRKQGHQKRKSEAALKRQRAKNKAKRKQTETFFRPALLPLKGTKILMSETVISRRHYLNLKNDTFEKSDNEIGRQLTYIEVAIYCNALSEEENREPCYSFPGFFKPPICDTTKNGYRLPTLEEWNRAAYCGNEANPSTFTEEELLRNASFMYSDTCVINDFFRPYMKKAPPNEWGFYDMIGFENERVESWKTGENYAAQVSNWETDIHDFRNAHDMIRESSDISQLGNLCFRIVRLAK